jgi:hypothetical protein
MRLDTVSLRGLFNQQIHGATRRRGYRGDWYRGSSLPDWPRRMELTICLLVL